MCTARISVPEGLWLIGNVDYMGFYRTNYDVSMWKRIIDQLHTDHTVRIPRQRRFYFAQKAAKFNSTQNKAHTVQNNFYNSTRKPCYRKGNRAMRPISSALKIVGSP